MANTFLVIRCGGHQCLFHLPVHASDSSHDVRGAQTAGGLGTFLVKTEIKPHHIQSNNQKYTWPTVREGPPLLGGRSCDCEHAPVHSKGQRRRCRWKNKGDLPKSHWAGSTCEDPQARGIDLLHCTGVDGWVGLDLLLQEGLESDSGPCTITKTCIL